MIAERATTSPPMVARCSLVDSAASVWAVLQAAVDVPADAEVRADTERALRVFEQRLRRLGISEFDLRTHLEHEYGPPRSRSADQWSADVHCLQRARVRRLTQAHPPGGAPGA